MPAIATSRTSDACHVTPRNLLISLATVAQVFKRPLYSDIDRYMEKGVLFFGDVADADAALP